MQIIERHLVNDTIGQRIQPLEPGEVSPSQLTQRGIIHAQQASHHFRRAIGGKGELPHEVRHVVFSPDGRWLAAVGGVGVHVWEWRIGDEVAAGSVGHRGAIVQLATVPGGLIATAGDDHIVRLWAAATGAERRRLQHGHWVRAIAVSPDGQFLASSSLDNSVRLWELSSGKDVFKLPGHGLHGGHRAVRFTPDGRRFLSFGDDRYLRIWDVRTGKALTENAVRPPGVVDPGNFDPAGREWSSDRAGLAGVPSVRRVPASTPRGVARVP